MNVEKFVKNEAKAALKGNWIKAITALFTELLVVLAVLLVIESAFEIMGDYDDFGTAAAENPVKLVFFILFHLLGVGGLLLLSPMFAGYVKIMCSLAKDKKSKIDDMFLYFSSGDIYKDCVKFMTRIIVSCVAVLILFELPCLGGYLLFEDRDYADIIVAVLGLLGVLGAYLFSLRYTFALMLYTDGLSINESFEKGAAVSKGNVTKLVKLTFSFIGWIISYILVVPCLYAVPYISCAHFISAKYLLEQYDQLHPAIPQTPVSMPVQNMGEVITADNSGSMFANPNYTSAQNAEPLTLSDIGEESHNSGGISLSKGGTVGGDL